MASILLATNYFNIADTGLGAFIVSAWGAGGAGGSNDNSSDGEDSGPGGNGGFVEFKIEGLLGTETITAYPGGGGTVAGVSTNHHAGGGGGAATVITITDGTNTDYLAVVGAGGGGGGCAYDPDNLDGTGGGEGGAEGGSGGDSQPNKSYGSVRSQPGGGGTQTTGGKTPPFATNVSVGSRGAAHPPTKGTYAQNGGNAINYNGTIIANVTQRTAGGSVGHSFGGAGGWGGDSNGSNSFYGHGGGGGGGWFAGSGGTGISRGDGGAGGGGGSTKLNTSPSGFSYLTITRVSTAMGTATPHVQHTGAASTQVAGSTNHFNSSVGGQGGNGAMTNGAVGNTGGNGRVVMGLASGSASLNTTSTSGGSVDTSTL